MAISKKQAEFDIEKWLKSESVGHDLCGDFEFCAKCDKSLENPCAAAYDAHSAPAPAPKKKTAKPAAKKEPAKKPTPAKPTAQKASVKITEKEQTRTTRNKTSSKNK